MTHTDIKETLIDAVTDPSIAIKSALLGAQDQNKSNHTDSVGAVEEIARALSQSIRYSCGKGQYDAQPDCQAAYLDGVETAIAMMYIDLTGSPKSQGMLAKFRHHQLQKARQTWLREEIVRLEGMKVGFTDVTFQNAYNSALQTIINRYQAELDQSNK